MLKLAAAQSHTIYIDIFCAFARLVFCITEVIVHAGCIKLYRFVSVQ